MARKKRVGELPSGNVRRRIFVGYEYLIDEKGEPILDAQGNQKKKRIYKSVTAANSTEADKMVDEIKGNKKKLRSYCNKTFLEARNQYIESMKGILSPSTIRGYVQMNTYFKDIDAAKVKYLDDREIQRWIVTFSENHAPKTVWNAYGLLNVVLSEYGIQPNVKLPAKEIKDVYVPSDKDVQTLVKYFADKGDNDMLIAISIASFATLRRSEICGLSANDVNGNIIHTHSAVVVDDKNEIVKKKTLKNQSSDRYIEVPRFLIDMLPKDGMLVNISPDVITHRFRSALKKCGIKHFRFHDLRHYSASIMHAIGVPDVYIMDRGGWKSDYTLKKIYRGTIEDYKKQFVSTTNKHFDKVFHNAKK